MKLCLPDIACHTPERESMPSSASCIQAIKHLQNNYLSKLWQVNDIIYVTVIKVFFALDCCVCIIVGVTWWRSSQKMYSWCACGGALVQWILEAKKGKRGKASWAHECPSVRAISDFGCHVSMLGKTVSSLITCHDKPSAPKFLPPSSLSQQWEIK